MLFGCKVLEGMVFVYDKFFGCKVLAPYVNFLYL
jgi:hypothetical protein